MPLYLTKLLSKAILQNNAKPLSPALKKDRYWKVLLKTSPTSEPLWILEVLMVCCISPISAGAVSTIRLKYLASIRKYTWLYLILMKTKNESLLVSSNYNHIHGMSLVIPSKKAA